MQTLGKEITKSLTNTKVNQFKKDIQDSTESAEKLRDILNFGGLYIGARSLFSTMKNIAQANVDMIETYNLFEVSMEKVENAYGNLDKEASQYYTKAMKFQNEMNEQLATNKAELMEYQAMYFSMFKNQGIDKNASYFMSENLTKAGYDIASLYNLQVEQAMEKIRAGIAGQVEPLRAIGIDISESALNRVLDDLGIERSVQQLTYAEKELARYIEIIRQAGQAQGDFANTMEAPANQLKILTSQFQELRQVAGAFIINTFGNAIVYLNGIIMAIKEVLKSFAVLFGYDLETGGGNMSTALGIEEVSDDLGTATAKAKEFKKQLMGFDEINNITLPTTSSGGGSATNTPTGIDSRFLEELEGWNNKMSEISGRAQEIRDKIMEWLGFVKIIDPLTGQVSFKLKEGWTNLKLIQTALKVIAGVVVTLTGLKVIGKLTKIITALKTFKTASSEILIGLNALTTGFNKNTTAMNTTTGKVGKHAEVAKTATSSVGKLEAGVAKVTTGLVGFSLSTGIANSAMEELSEGTISTSEAGLKLAGSLAGATASGALMGSAFGPVGIAIGAVGGFAISATSALMSYKTENDKLCESISESKKETEEYIQSIQDQKKAIEDSLNTELAQLDYTERLANELDTLIDQNGKVKVGYEDRVSFILSELKEATGVEIEMVNGTIKNYKELREEINSIIEAKKAEVTLNAYQAEYENAIKRQIENQHKKLQSQDKLNQATEAYNDKVEKIIETFGSLEEAQRIMNTPLDPRSTIAHLDAMELGKLETAMNEAKEEVSSLAKQIEDDNRTIILWEDLKTATITGNAEEIARISQELTNSYRDESGNQIGTISEQIAKEIDLANERKKVWEENGIEMNQTNKAQLETAIRTTAEKLVEQTGTIKTLTEDQINAWKLLAEGSEQVYNEKISLVDKDTKLVLDAITNNIDTSSPDYVQKWNNLATNSEETYNTALSLLPEDTRIIIESAIGKINAKQRDAGTAGANLANEIDSKFETNLGNTENVAKNWLQPFVDILTSWDPLGILGLVKNLSDRISSKFKPTMTITASTQGESVKAYASGGMPSMGEVFVAREAGPELVGRIGSRTAVMNNGQIVDAVKVGVYEAVSSAMSSSRNVVQLDVRADEGIIVKKASEGFEKHVMQTGELPFTVPV